MGPPGQMWQPASIGELISFPAKSTFVCWKQLCKKFSAPERCLIVTF
jgi:hypothetical protein